MESHANATSVYGRNVHIPRSPFGNGEGAKINEIWETKMVFSPPLCALSLTTGERVLEECVEQSVEQSFYRSLRRTLVENPAFEQCGREEHSRVQSVY